MKKKQGKRLRARPWWVVSGPVMRLLNDGGDDKFTSYLCLGYQHPNIQWAVYSSLFTKIVASKRTNLKDPEGNLW